MSASNTTLTPISTVLISARQDEPVRISAGPSTVSYGTTTALGSTIAAGKSKMFTHSVYVRSTGTIQVQQYEAWENDEVLQIRSETTDFTLSTEDTRRVVEVNSTDAVTVTVPPETEAGFAVGDIIEICRLGTGTVTLAGGTGVTLDSAGGILDISDQYASVRLRKRDTDEWVITGDLGSSAVPPVATSDPIAYVGVGTAATGADVASLTPALPTASIEDGDTLVVAAYASAAVAITASSDLTQIVTDAGQSGNALAIFTKQLSVGATAPTISFASSATKSCVAQCAVFRNLNSDPQDVTSALAYATSVQNIGPIAGITPSAPGSLVIVLGGRRDDWTSVATLSGDSLTWGEIGDIPVTDGTIDAGMVWDYAIDAEDTTTTVTDKTFTVTGGSTANNRGVMISLLPASYTVPVSPYLAEDNCQTADPTTIWGTNGTVGIDAAASGRHVQLTTGGSAGGYARSLEAHDGDDYYGERCELGHNENRNGIGGGSGTFYLYADGHTATTHWRFKLDSAYPISNANWQDIAQWKQCEPYTDPTTPVGVAMELQVRANRLYLRTFWTDRGSIPIVVNQWYDVLHVCTYANDSSGTVSLTVSEWDGATATNAQTLTYNGPNLSANGSGVIPSHFRLGTYRNPTISVTTKIYIEDIWVDE